MEDLHQITHSFKALAHKRRVLLFKLLLKNGRQKLSFGQLQKISKIPVAPLTHHLAFLEKGGLIYRQSRGSHTYFALQLQSFRSVLKAVQNQCDPDKNSNWG
jgi:DNA-binding transcriptional ArsR family regulator